MHKGALFYNSINPSVKMQDLKNFSKSVKVLLLETEDLYITTKYHA
jgi:hypothetical protein